jgi:predicted DNA-binding antitoxin AbrB/MazE fold protein
MHRIITAIFENGVLKPREPLDLLPGTQVQLMVVATGQMAESLDQDWEEFEHLCDEMSFDSGGRMPTRDELHERR